MSAQKATGCLNPKTSLRSSDNCRFRAAHVRQERSRGKMRSKFLNQLNDSAYRRREQDQVAARARRNGVGDRGINRTDSLCLDEYRVAVTADDLPAKPVGFSCKRERAPDQSGPDDRDLAKCWHRATW